MYKISCPATTANIGPGFDTLGMALNLYNHFYFDRRDEFEFEGIDEKYANTDNLVIKSYISAFDYKHENVQPVLLKMDVNVPLSRGLGSSATCIIAGLLGANLYLKNKMTEEEILSLATKIEGHPDNVAPCLLGGLVASFVSDKVYYVKYSVSENIKIMALVPDFPLSTEASREVLPKSISIKDAVYNISHAINIPYAFTNGKLDLLYECMNDKIHQPYRFPLIKDSKLFIDYAKNNKLPLVISGAGSTLLMLSNKYEEINIDTKASWKILNISCNMEGSIVHES